jgi:hypothetical protein
MTCQFFTGSSRLYDAITGSDIFAGTSVEIKSFSANLGTGGSESSVDLDLVYNQCSNAGVGNLNTGYAVIFQCNGFIFGGFVDRLEYNESESGIGWKVRIVDPRKFLENVQILLDGYYCGINNFTNFINVQNILEGSSTGPACAGISIPELQLPSLTVGCPNYGNGKLGAGRTSYLSALSAIQAGGPPLKTIYGDNIFYDLTPIINVASTVPYAGSDSPNTTLLGLITSACDEAGFDFGATLNGGTINFYTINRRVQTSLSSLPSLISAYRDGPNPTLISSSYGTETSYQTTKKVVLGDNIQYLKYGNTINQTRMIIGYNNGVPMTANYDQLSAGVEINASVLSAILAEQGVSLSSFPSIKENEIIAAKGSYQFWTLYCQQNPTSIGGIVGSQIFGALWNTSGSAIAQGLNFLQQRSENDAKGKVLDQGVALLNNAADAVKLELFKQVHKWIQQWSQEYYGVQWLVAIPSPVCYKGYVAPGPSIGANSQSTLVSDEISDAGWTDSGNVIGLVPRSVDTTLFETNDGRLKCFVALPTNFGRIVPFAGKNAEFFLDPAKLSSEFYVKNGYVYFSANAEENIYAINSTTIGVVIKTSPIGLTFNNTGSSLLSDGLNTLSLTVGNIPAFPEGQGATNGAVHEYNIFKAGTAAGVFTHCCIPFKSNMYVYGPWWSASGVEGGTEIVKNSDLNPWTYGSTSIMSNVGLALATEGIRAQVTSETGTLVVAEAPAFSLGPLNAYAGLVLGSAVVNFGASGITTTYNFQTFAQKFGNYARNLSDRIKETASLKREIYDVIRSARQKNLSNLNSVRKAAFAARLSVLNTPQAQVTSDASSNNTGTKNDSSPVLHVIGSYPYSPNVAFPPSGNSGGGAISPTTKNKLDCSQLASPPVASYSPSSTGSSVSSKASASVGMDKVYSGIHYADQNNFNAYAITSLDALLSPVSLNGSGGLSKFALSCYNNPSSFPNKPRPVMPPVLTDIGIVGGMVINGRFLNPMCSSTILSGWDSRASGSSVGFSLQTISYGTDPSKLFSDSITDEKQSATDFRFNALKGPLVLQSWGYDTEGKPIPNAVDGPADCINGYFEESGLQDKFMPNWQADPRVWPVGPIDLRWDRQRGVWVSPPSERLVVAQLLTDLVANGSSQAILLNPGSAGGTFYQDHDVYGPQGEHITGNVHGAKILVNDFLGRKLCAGTVIYAYHYGEGKYLALEASLVDAGETCPPCTTTETTTTTTQTTTATTATTTEATTTQTTTTPVTTTATTTYITTVTTSPTTTYTTTVTTTYTTTLPTPYYCYYNPSQEEESTSVQIVDNPDYPPGNILDTISAGPGQPFCYNAASIYIYFIDCEGLPQTKQFYGSGPYYDISQCLANCEPVTQCYTEPTTTTVPPTTPPPIQYYCYQNPDYMPDGEGGTVFYADADECNASSGNIAESIPRNVQYFCSIYNTLYRVGECVGFSPVSGPYATAEDCAANCGIPPTTTLTTSPPTPTTFPTTTSIPPTPTTPPCDVCGLAACLEVYGKDGVLGISGGCLTIYPLVSCPSEGE